MPFLAALRPFDLFYCPKIRLIQFNLAKHLSAFQFGNMKQDNTRLLVDSTHRLGINTQITGQPVG